MSRLSHSLIVRGMLFLLLGLGATVWPEECLVPGLLGVSVIAVLFGLYEMSIADALRHRAAHWRLILVHGLSIVLFGFMTAGTTIPRLHVMQQVVAAWLMFYAFIVWRGSVLARELPAALRALSACAWINGMLAVIVASYGATTIFALLYLGAVYAAALGAWQLIAGIGIARMLRSHDRHRIDHLIMTA